MDGRRRRKEEQLRRRSRKDGGNNKKKRTIEKKQKKSWREEEGTGEMGWNEEEEMEWKGIRVADYKGWEWNGRDEKEGKKS